MAPPKATALAGPAVVRLVVVRGLAELLQAEPGRNRAGQRPVARALGDAFGLSMGMLAVLITAGSVLLPIVVIGGAVWWGLRSRRPAAT